MPTFLVQNYVYVLLPFLTMMCNCLIREAQLPSSQKRSILHPVLKREGLDQITAQLLIFRLYLKYLNVSLQVSWLHILMLMTCSLLTNLDFGETTLLKLS